MADESELEAARRRALSPVLGLDDFRPVSSAVGVEFGVRSHTGRGRAVNEDHYLIVRLARSQDVIATSLPDADVIGHFEEFGYGMIVCDGVGGTGTGAAASRIALSTLTHLAVHYGQWNLRVDGRTAREIIDRMEWFYRRVNEAIVDRAGTDPALATMATTMTAAFTAGDDLFLAHVGHSRAYVFRDGALTQLTSDQTLEQRLADSPPGPAPVQRATEDLRHILTETIGGRPGGPTVQLSHFRLWDGDCVLLCTDGLTSKVDADEIGNVLALPRRLNEQCDALVDLALERGSQENITAVIARYRVPRP
jgi:protein phosphatase